MQAARANLTALTKRICICMWTTLPIPKLEKKNTHTHYLKVDK
jgi:hypothetical protein